MKKLFTLFLLTLLPLAAIAATQEIDGIYYNLFPKLKTAEVTSNPNGYSGSITIPDKVTFDGVEYSVTAIGDKAFYQCGITSIIVPNSVTSIGECAFQQRNLTSVNIPNSVTTIKYAAFAWCSNLSSVNIPNSVTTIEMNAFDHCESLTSVTIPNSLTKLTGFSYCTGLTSITIPNNVTTIGMYAFTGCTGLTSVTIPNSVTIIEEAAFSECTFTSVTIPNSVTYIYKIAFAFNNSLTSVSIGSGVKTIEGCFYNCPDLMDVYCYAEKVTDDRSNEEALWTESFTFQNSYPEYCTLHVPEGCVEAYKAITPWNQFKEIVPMAVTQYTLTYMVDGEEYKSYQVAEGSAITPEPAPKKDGYVFSGWSKIPATMPSENVTITGTFALASNEDEIVLKATGKTTYCSYYDLDFTNVEGLKAYTATGYDDLTKTIWLTRVMTVPAGTGLFIKGAANTPYKVPHTTVRSYYTNMLKGNLDETMTIGETDGEMTNYYLSGKDGTFKSVNKSANIGTNKAYLQLPTSVFAGATTVGTRFDDEDASTGIEVQSSIFNIQSNEVYYNLQGQRVDNPRKGIYIKNGRRVVVK